MSDHMRVFILALVAWTASGIASAQAVMTADLASRYLAPEHAAVLNSSADDYAPRFDPMTSSLCITSERGGNAAVFCCGPSGAAADMSFRSVAPTLAEGTFNEGGMQRAFVSFAANGDAIGAAYIMRGSRPYMGVVNVLRDGHMLNCGLPIERVNGRFFSSHPTLSANGLRLVMSSDRLGDGHGLDLFISERMPGGEWSEPSALSPLINSAGDEMTPVFIGTDSLLFASNGYGGKGGMDLFLSVYEDGAWQEPVPLDWLNTEFDETDACMLPNGTIIFASNRPGGRGGLDLYIVPRR